jgi:acetolactate synthase-1/3 small subunit
LYNLPVDEGEDNKYTLSVLVDNEAGVLSKVSGLLAGRGFNIDSLTVSTTDVRELSRMTITLKGPETQMDQARKQLEDLVQVWAVLDAGRNAINREMCMIKVSTLPPDSRPAMGNSLSYIPDYQDNMNAHFHKEAVIQTSKLFGGVVVDVGSDQMIIELVSWQRRIDAFIRTMKPFGVIEVARSGAITMPRVPVAGGADHDDDTPNQATDVSALPPS